jgi:hypothetical protein
VLFGPGKGQIMTVPLNAGRYSWPFTLTLPNQIPPSCNHPAGKARVVFEIKAELGQLQSFFGSFDNQKKEKVVPDTLFLFFFFLDIPGAPNVYAQMGLTILSRAPAQMPQFDPPSGKGEKTFLFSKLPLRMEASLDRASCSMGKPMNAIIFLNNQSSKVVRGIKINIVQVRKEGKKEKKKLAFFLIESFLFG